MPGANILEWRRLARQRTPIHLILFVTDRCNARCGTCFYWQNLNRGCALELPQVEAIARSFGEIVWLDISGGEPFLRKDLPAVCHTFARQNRVRFINIPTNGIQTDQIVSLVAEILAGGDGFQLNIAVSLDGVGETHDRIRGVPGNYGKAVATLAELRRLRRDQPRLSVSVVTTLMAGNAEDVKQLLEMACHEWDVDYHSINVLRGSPQDAALAPPSAAQFQEVAKLQLQHLRHYYRGRFGRLDGWMALAGRVLLNRYYLRDLQGRPKDIACNAGQASCVVDANGDVYFCELLEKLGNLKEYDWDFQKLWYDRPARELRARLRRGCHCTHECFHTKNLILTPWRLL
jgi:MoaA/NifB/PqqE/SkfB family radical SAM enzyme